MLELHETVAVPLPTMLLGEIWRHVRLEGSIVVRDVVPTKPLIACIVRVALVEEPARVVGEVAVIVKSWNRNVAVATWDREPLFAVIVSV